MKNGASIGIGMIGREAMYSVSAILSDHTPFQTTLVIELANDCPAYIPTQKAFAEGSYETVNSRIQSGGGEKMVEAAVRLLKALAE